MVQHLTDPLVLDSLQALALAAISEQHRRPAILGICGAQGCGKSTVAAELRNLLELRGLSCAVMSLDDLYKTRADRLEMAREVHPLFATRGVPGTHDLGLLEDVIEQLSNGRPARLPRFDKAKDERASPTFWETAEVGTELLLFEGWCVGARGPISTESPEPINSLEKSEDPYGIWRAAVDRYLNDEYRELFNRIDKLALLAAPGFDVVLGWRLQQEHVLRSATNSGMPDEQIAHFVFHFERLTRRILNDMPAYADLVMHLDPSRRLAQLRYKHSRDLST